MKQCPRNGSLALHSLGEFTGKFIFLMEPERVEKLVNALQRFVPRHSIEFREEQQILLGCHGFVQRAFFRQIADLLFDLDAFLLHVMSHDFYVS